MAIKYCDHGAYPAYSATPTWGAPQDGDGLSQAASTASAIASIVFSGVPSGTISVCGVTVSPTWGASADAAANGLATAINAATGNVTTTGFRAGAVQLRNAVFARGPSGGAPAGTCQIMTRHGSALFNDQIAIAHTLTNVDAGASSLAFSGGVSGCWGYIYAGGTIWPGAINNYGLWCAGATLAGSISPGDVIHIRGGKDISLANNAASVSANVVLSAVGTIASPVRFVVADTSVWASDGDEPQLILRRAALGGSSKAIFTIPSTAAVRIEGKRYSDVKYAVVFAGGEGSGSTGDLNWDVSINGPHVLTGVDFDNSDGYGTISSSANSLPANGYGATISQFRFKCKTGMSQAFFRGTGNNSFHGVLTFMDGVVDAGSPTSAHQGVFNMGNANSVSRFSFDAVRFINFVAGSKLVSAQSTSAQNGISLRNCDLGGISVVGPNYFGAAAEMADRFRMNGNAATSNIGQRDFFLDTPRGMAAWLSTRNFPTLAATLADGTTKWSMQIIPTSSQSNISPNTPFYTPRIVKVNTFADGVRTLTANFGIEESLLWDRSNFGFIVEYEDLNGVVRMLDTTDANGSPFDASSAVWSNPSGSQFTFSNGGVLYFNKFQISLSTPTPVKAGSEIGITFKVVSPVSNDTQMVFVDPEVLVL